MSDNERREQVIRQCEAVAHMAKAVAGVYGDYVTMFRDGHAGTLIDLVGERTAHLMEALGDILNGMDAVDETEDAWLDPVFIEARRLWPEKPEGRAP